MPSENLQNVIVALKELEADTSMPKNVKLRVQAIIKVLEQNGETSIKVSKALSELEALTEDVNMPSFTRTQLFNISSMLEAL